MPVTEHSLPFKVAGIILSNVFIVGSLLLKFDIVMPIYAAAQAVHS